MFEGFAETEQTLGGPEYQVLARRTRPQSFSQLVGQESAVRAIEGMIQNGKIPHAFLFTGTRGTGKTSSARILAKSLCCEQGPTLTPCQTCTHCVQITACAHEDVFEIDGASHTGVDNIRELRESARFFPQSSRYKIFIIDEVHMLSIGAFNALLKTLEEPPPQVIFILATTELHKVPVTVRSRCMILSFRKIDPTTIAQHLANVLDKDGIAHEAEALQLISREAKGSLRDALSLLEQVLALGGHREVNFSAAKAALSVMGDGISQQLFAGILERDAQKCLEAIAEIDAASLDFSYLLEQTSLLFRGAVVLKQAGQDQARLDRANELLNLLPSELDFIKKASENVSAVALIEIYRALAHAAREILRTNAQRAWAEITVMDCISRSEWLSSDELSHLMLSSADVGEPTRPAGMQTTQSSTPIGPQPAKSNKIPTHSAEPQVQERGPSAQARDTKDNLPSEMLDLYASLISQIQSRNMQLAVKLKHAKLTQFTHQRLVFTDCPENKLFAQLSETEAEIFLQALNTLGCGGCQIEGLSLPGNLLQKRQAGGLGTNSKPTTVTDNSVETSARASSTTDAPKAVGPQSQVGSKERPVGKTREAIASLSREDPFGTKTNKTPDQKKNNESNLNIPAGGISLASVEQAEEARKWQARQTELRSKPLLKKLEALGAEIEMVPLKPGERGR